MATALTATAAASGEEGIVQVDLTFPRNETYASAEWLPFVFAYQNAKPGTCLNSQIHLDIWPYNDSDLVTSQISQSHIRYARDQPFQ